MQELDNTKSPSLRVERYFDICKELTASILAARGIKIIDQQSAIMYLEREHPTACDYRLLDQLRKLRNNLVYEGKIPDSRFMSQNESRCARLVKDLHTLATK